MLPFMHDLSGFQVEVSSTQHQEQYTPCSVDMLELLVSLLLFFSAYFLNGKYPQVGTLNDDPESDPS